MIMMSRLKYFNNGNAIPRNGQITQPFTRMSSGIGYHPIYGYGVHGGRDFTDYDNLKYNLNENLGGYNMGGVDANGVETHLMYDEDGDIIDTGPGISIDDAIRDNRRAMIEDPERAESYLAEIHVLEHMRKGDVPYHTESELMAHFIRGPGYRPSGQRILDTSVDLNAIHKAEDDIESNVKNDLKVIRKAADVKITDYNDIKKFREFVSKKLKKNITSPFSKKLYTKYQKRTNGVLYDIERTREKLNESKYKIQNDKLLDEIHTKSVDKAHEKQIIDILEKKRQKKEKQNKMVEQFRTKWAIAKKENDDNSKRRILDAFSQYAYISKRNKIFGKPTESYIPTTKEQREINKQVGIESKKINTKISKINKDSEDGTLLFNTILKSKLDELDITDPEDKAIIDDDVDYIKMIKQIGGDLNEIRDIYLSTKIDLLNTRLIPYTPKNPENFPGFEKKIQDININLSKRKPYNEDGNKQLAYIIQHITDVSQQENTTKNNIKMGILVNLYNNIVQQHDTIGIENNRFIVNPELPTISDFITPSGDINPKNPHGLAGGLAFEGYFEDNFKRFCKMIGCKTSNFRDNGTNPNIYTEMAKTGYIFDYSTDDAELELKNYNTGVHNIGFDDILRDGGIGIQMDKLGTPFLMPLYETDGDNYKLFNILSTNEANARRWVNDTTGKDVKFVFKTSDGYYTYDLTKDQDYNWTDVRSYIILRSVKNSTNPWKDTDEDLKKSLESLTDEQKDNLFIPTIPDSYNLTKVYGTKPGFFIPPEKLIKHYLKHKQ